MEFRSRKKTSSQSEQHTSAKRRKKDENFAIGEKILCFEPDDRLERVLYDAKIKEINEVKDKKGKTTIEYLVHFFGWSNSWDRRVSGDFILKETPENRQLQKELAEKSQLQLGAYLYRKERKKRKKINERKLLLASNEDFKPSEEDLEYYSSNSAGSSLEEDDRVFLHIGEVLKTHIEYDNKMVLDKVKPVLPAHLPVVTILEHFVKSYAMKTLTKIPEQKKPKRRHSSIFGKKELKITNDVDYESIEKKIDLCKEVADGLRVYFNFILKDFLLYSEEKKSISLDFTKNEILNIKKKEIVLNFNDFYRKSQNIPEKSPPVNEPTDQNLNQDRKSSRLRSQSGKVINEENEKSENASAQSSSSGGESLTYENEKRGIMSKSWFPLNAGLSTEATKILEEVFAWRMLPENEPDVEPSTIFGIYYLLRLVVKLPEFLSATPMNEEKLTLLLRYLDDFVLFLEENEELYGQQNYENSEN